MANRMIDMTDWVVGKLVVLRPALRTDNKGVYYWLCRCDCGKEKEISGTNLRYGKYLSCGCEARRLSSERRKATKKEPKPCNVEGCSALVGNSGAKGMCAVHYMRVKRHGDPHYSMPREVWKERCRQAQPSLGQAQPQTYYKYYGKHAHRCVMADKLGRDLSPGEIVHHDDEDKHNNDPDNLMAMTRADHLRVHRAEMMRRRKEIHGY